MAVGQFLGTSDYCLVVTCNLIFFFFILRAPGSTPIYSSAVSGMDRCLVLTCVEVC